LITNQRKIGRDSLKCQGIWTKFLWWRLWKRSSRRNRRY